MNSELSRCGRYASAPLPVYCGATVPVRVSDVKEKLFETPADSRSWKPKNPCESDRAESLSVKSGAVPSRSAKVTITSPGALKPPRVDSHHRNPPNPTQPSVGTVTVNFMCAGAATVS